ncbi:MAG TPA: hypothetical protein DCP92_03240 [Nitrospiraceae bacterium]|jgi:hypothetical protein|nr:hypothetical protein [Nitrospiraceae bacterium]
MRCPGICLPTKLSTLRAASRAFFVLAVSQRVLMEKQKKRTNCSARIPRDALSSEIFINDGFPALACFSIWRRYSLTGRMLLEDVRSQDSFGNPHEIKPFFGFPGKILFCDVLIFEQG